MRNPKSRQKHGGKSQAELDAYKRLIQGTRASKIGDTAIEPGELEGKVSSDSSDASLKKKEGTTGVNPEKPKPKKKPYRSAKTYFREEWQGLLVKVGGAVVLALFTTGLTIIWSLNREVGVMQRDVADLQDKYKNLPSISSTEYSVFRAEVEKDLQYIKERLQKVELRLFR